MAGWAEDSLYGQAVVNAASFYPITRSRAWLGGLLLGAGTTVESQTLTHDEDGRRRTHTAAMPLILGGAAATYAGGSGANFGLQLRRQLIFAKGQEGESRRLGGNLAVVTMTW